MRQFLFAGALLLLFALAACSSGGGNENGPVGLAVTPGAPALFVGLTQQFTAIATYDDETTEDVTEAVIWSSSDSSVATIDAAGLATAAGAGSATITATSGEISDTAILTVSTPALVSLAVEPADPVFERTETQQLTATGTFDDGSSEDVSGSVTWSSSDDTIADVDEAGLVSGIGAGTATITAASGEITGTAGVTVTFPAQGSAESPETLSDPGPVTLGSVSTGRSYYRLDAVGDETYDIRLRELSDDADLFVYEDSLSAPWVCRPFYGRTEEESCTVTTDSGTTSLLFVVDGSYSVAGAEYELYVRVQQQASVQPPSAVDEGSVASPVPIVPGVINAERNVGTGSSYYAATVTPGVRYVVSVTEGAEVDLHYFDTDATFTTAACDSAVGGSTEQCAITAGGATVYFSVASTGAGAIYHLAVYRAEGGSSAPQPLPAGKYHSGQVDDAASYYVMPVTAGEPYTLNMQQLDFAPHLLVYDGDPNFGTPACEGEAFDVLMGRAGAIPVERCILTPGSDTLYIEVDGSTTSTGASFTLRAGPYVGEGYEIVDATLTAAPFGVVPPHAGEVDVFFSAYAVPVTPATSYTVSLTGLSDDVTLQVFDDALLRALLCGDPRFTLPAKGVADESCTATPTGSTMYVQVGGTGTAAGADFTLEVTSP